MPRIIARPARWTGICLLCLLVACTPDTEQKPRLVAAREGPGATAAPVASAVGRTDYVREAAALTGAIDAATRQLDRQPGNTQLAVETVSLYLERARMSGDYGDYRLAEVLLDAALQRENRASFECLTQSGLHYTLHRLQAAAAALANCRGQASPSEAGALNADIAFYSGRYQQAEDGYRALVNQVGNFSHYTRLALYRSRTGSIGEAAALLEAAEKRYHGRSATTRAWLKLQRGLLAWERGRLDEAQALYLLAADELPGWWLVDEHLAEVRWLGGDLAGAQALYEKIIARHGLPEHMDGLARVLREGSTPAAATPWISRAQAAYQQRLKDFPEAAIGHAVEHFMAFGTPAQALELARRDAQLRPFGETQTTLAAALYRAGQVREAAALISRVQSSGWKTARTYAVAAQIHAGLGQHAQAEAQRAQALAMNPHAMRLHQVARRDAVSTP